MGRIVIVDDSQVLRNQWKKALTDEGFQVEEASSSSQLYEILSSNTINLIILELFLGTEPGSKIIQDIKDSVEYSHIPIVVASPERRREEIQEVIDMGISDYLIKPFEIEFMIMRIKQVLLGRGNLVLTI